MARKTFEASTEKLLHFVEVNFPVVSLYVHFLKIYRWLKYKSMSWCLVASEAFFRLKKAMLIYNQILNCLDNEKTR